MTFFRFFVTSSSLINETLVFCPFLKSRSPIGVEVRYRTWVPVVVFDTPACNGWKSSWGGLIFDKNTRGVVLVAPGPKWDALRVIPGGIILIPEVSF